MRELHASAMYRSSQNRRLDDEQWKLAFEILERRRHLPLVDRRKFVESATDDPDVLDLLFELLTDEADADVQIAPDQPGEPKTGERVGVSSLQLDSATRMRASSGGRETAAMYN